MRFLQVLLLGAVAAGANAGTLYRIDFEGTVTRGSLRGTTNVQGSYNLGFEVGGPVRGHVLLDLGLAPAQSDTTNGGLFRTEFSDILGAAWLAAWVELVLPELPADALPVPSSFVVAPGGLPGATYSAPVEASRSAAFTSGAGCCNTVLTVLDFAESGTAGTQLFQHAALLGLLITSVDPFFAPGVAQPAPFTASNLAGGSLFQYLQFERDATNETPPLFGFRESYVVDVSFDLTSASGSVVTPEPGAVGLCLGGLVLGWWKMRRRSR